MISPKLAFRSVIRRPKQNFAVILGIALGVSLFVGVQVGGDSLGEGMRRLSIHSLGETDSQIYNPVYPFFVTNNTIQQELNIPVPEQDIAKELQESGDHLNYAKGIAGRLELSVTALEPTTGSIEISKSLTGISENETGFGEFVNPDGNTLELADLEEDEVYIGEETAELLFLDENPIGRTLTLQTTLFSLSIPSLNISSQAIPLQLNVTIKDVFLDEGRGREKFADYIATPLDYLQSKVSQTYANNSLLGFGAKPISKIIVNWNDDIRTGEESLEATRSLENSFRELVQAPYSQLYVVEDTRNQIEESVEQSVDSLEMILNVFGSIIIVAGILVIINIQNMALAARERETGILRAIGSSKGQIVRANLIESMFLGIFGSLVGLLGGILYGRLLVFFLGIAFQFPTGDIPTVVTQQTLITSFLAGFVISQITGLIPAISASRINVARVLRGIDPPEEESFGKKSLYLGILLTIIALIGIVTLDPNPLWDGQIAFEQLEDAENIYPFIALAVAGPALLIAYFKNKKLGITVVGLFLLFWGYFNIFVVFDWIKAGSGGLNYVLFIILSLVGGSIILISINLGTIANIGQKITSWFSRNRETPIRGTTMVAFRKMRSNVTRSTLTFALFAVILTLNIFIGTWSYSFRYGFDTQIAEIAGGSDMMLYSSDNALPSSLDFSEMVIDQFGTNDRDVTINHITAMTMISNNPYYLALDGNEESKREIKMVAMEEHALWADDTREDWVFPFNLGDNKTGTPFEYYEDQDDDPAATEEDEAVWKALLNNETIPNKDGENKPIIITTTIADFTNNQFNELKRPGDSIYLNLTSGGTQEFVIASTTSNPVADFQSTEPNGPPTFNPTGFVSNVWKSKLNAFSGFANSENLYLGQTSETDINSDKIPELLTEIEQWANKEGGEFRDQHGLYGIIGVAVYDIYEATLEGTYRFFGFLQAFTSLGFAVGILGLLVVASRSVAERTREIGMLRALGFRRGDIVVSVVLELIVMGLIGLFLGFINGTVMGYALTDINSGGEATFLIPWWLIGLYGAITLISAIIAAIFPAIKASRIPASDALRYTG